MKPKRLSCQQYIAARAKANRDRQAVEAFNQMERDAIRARLSKDAPTREKEKNETLEIASRQNG
jgi:hypothetical protein